MRRYELTDAQWGLIEDLFPKQTMGRPRRSDRTALNGIFWILCSGAAWRDLPERYGPWKTVYHRFRQWQKSGLTDRLLARHHIEPPGERGLIDCSTWMVDSTSIRASRVASGAPKKKGARRTARLRAWTLPRWFDNQDPSGLRRRRRAARGAAFGR